MFFVSQSSLCKKKLQKNNMFCIFTCVMMFVCKGLKQNGRGKFLFFRQHLFVRKKYFFRFFFFLKI